MTNLQLILYTILVFFCGYGIGRLHQLLSDIRKMMFDIIDDVQDQKEESK